MPTTPTPPLPPVALTYWPGPLTTGVPATARLSSVGPQQLRRDGQVLSDLTIIGNINVYADNVTIRRCKIIATGSPSAIRVMAGALNLTVEDVEIDGLGATGAIVTGGNYTLRRVNIHNAVDGPRLDTNSTIVDSWIHDLRRLPDTHNDALQTTGGSRITVRHNRLDAYRADLADPMNACLMIGSTVVPTVEHLLFEDNYCNGGNYTIGVRSDLTASDIMIRGNRFTRNYRYGVIARPQQTGIWWDPTNVWFDTGAPINP